MEKRRLGATDIEITPIGLGCMQFAGPGTGERMFSALDQETATSIVRAARDGGINWFDSAEMYGKGHSERLLATSLGEIGVRPGDVVIATKWTPTLRTASSIRATIDARLGALRDFPIDLHQIHLPYGGLSPLSSQVAAMADLREAGQVASVGVSNFSARRMEKADHLLRSRGTVLASNQVKISLLDRDIERNGVLDMARRLGVTLIAYSPLKSGLLSGKFHDDPARVRSLSRMRKLIGGIDNRTLTRSAPLIDELRAIGRAYGVSAGQVALSWLTTFYGDTVVAIPGATRPGQAEESAAAMDFRLTEAELERIDELSRACLRR